MRAICISVWAIFVEFENLFLHILNMNSAQQPVLAIPPTKITYHRIWQLDKDSIRAQEIADPFFDVGGISMAIAYLPNYQGELHVPENHRFFLVLQGRMRVRFIKETVIAQAGDLVCMPKDILTSRQGIGPLSVACIEFTDHPLWEPLKSLGQSIRYYESTDLLYILIYRLTEASRLQDVYSMQCARENAQTLVQLMRRELHQSANPLRSQTTQQLVKLLGKIRDNPGHMWNRQNMSKELNMSERNMTRAFQRTFNMPPAKMIISIRMDIASSLLVETNMTLREVADAVGYDSAFSFSRLFKKHIGISPGHYRSLPRNQQDAALSSQA